MPGTRDPISAPSIAEQGLPQYGTSLYSESIASILGEPKRRGGHAVRERLSSFALLQINRERCLAAGMDAYLSKPLHAEQPQAVLQRWIRGAQTGTGTPQKDAKAQSLSTPSSQA